MRTTIVTLTLAILAAAGFAAIRSSATPPPNLERALAAQRALAAEAPNDPQVLNDLGNLLVVTGRTEEAEEAYRGAIEMEPGLVAAHYNLGLLLAESGRRKMATKQFETVVELEPDHAWAHYQLGAVFDARGSDRKAIRRYARAFRLDPQLAFQEVNPHVIDNQHVTEAMLLAFRDMPASARAPKTYENPSRIVSLMISDEQAADGMAAPRQAGEDTAPMPGEAKPGAQTSPTGAGPRGAIPPVTGEEEEPPAQGKVLRREDLEQERGLNQAPSGGSSYYPPRGGVRSAPERRQPGSRYQPPTGNRGNTRQIDPDTRQRFVPGIPSTGRLEMELLPGPGERDGAERG